MKKIRITAHGWAKTYEINVEIDYTGCSEGQLREWATRERIIAIQRTLRTRGEAYVANLNGSLTVKAAEIGTEKGNLENMVHKLTPEERKRLLAMLQKV